MTDKPFDHEEYSRERLQQTTPGAGEEESQVFQALVAERERAEKAEASQSAIAWAEQLHRAQIAEAELQAERETIADLRASNRVLAGIGTKAMKELKEQDTTIAELRTALQGLHADDEYVLGLLHVIAELRKALEHYGQHEAGCHVHYSRESGVWNAGICDCGLDKALAAIAATEEGTP